MNKELSYLVSNIDLERKFKTSNSRIKIEVYPELNQINNILDLLPGNICACFILLKTSENSGHWTCLCRSDNMIYYMDSYGVKPDGELSNIKPGLQYQLHENSKALTRLIRTIPKGFVFSYNNIQFQQYDANVNTCGKWCDVFCKCIFHGLTLEQFQQRLKQLIFYHVYIVRN
jgi:hypothetical protein